MVGVFPVWQIPPLLLLFSVAILPPLLRPWWLYVVYAIVTSTTTLGLWYLSDVPSTALLMVGGANLIGLAIGLGVQLFRLQARNENVAQLLLRFALVIALVLVVPPLVIEGGKRAEYGKHIPSRIDLQSIAYMHRGLKTHCAATAWNATITEIPKGLRQTPYRAGDTPLDPSNRWLSGLGCSQMGSDLVKIVLDALESSTAYYLSNGDEGVLIVPSRQLVIAMFNHG